jgi:hypothetical protein
MTAASKAQAGCADGASTCHLIRAASTEGEVIAAVRDYLGALDKAQLAAIPAGLLSLQINHARDIAAAAVELARHEATMEQHGPEAALVKDVATVLSTAAMRLAIISMQPGGTLS